MMRKLLNNVLTILIFVPLWFVGTAGLWAGFNFVAVRIGLYAIPFWEFAGAVLMVSVVLGLGLGLGLKRKKKE